MYLCVGCGVGAPDDYLWDGAASAGSGYNFVGWLWAIFSDEPGAGAFSLGGSSVVWNLDNSIVLAYHVWNVLVLAMFGESVLQRFVILACEMQAGRGFWLAGFPLN